MAKINAEVNRALREPDVVAKLALQGTTAAGGTPEAFRALIANEVRNWKAIAQKANIKVPSRSPLRRPTDDSAAAFRRIAGGAVASPVPGARP